MRRASVALASHQSTIRASASSNLQSSVYGARLLVHVVHEHVAPEGPRRGEVRLAVADFGHLAYEADEIVVARQHERIDQDSRLAAGRHFRKRLGDDERIEAERVAVDAAVRPGEGR